jgi:hypothetical protein
MDIEEIKNKMDLVKVVKSDKKEKRLKAIFKDEKGKEKAVHFGAKGGSTYIDHKDKEKRAAYVKRHSENPLEKKFLNKRAYADKPANLAKDILWGPSTSLSRNIQEYKKKYKV